MDKQLIEVFLEEFLDLSYHINEEYIKTDEVVEYRMDDLVNKKVNILLSLGYPYRQR